MSYERKTRAGDLDCAEQFMRSILIEHNERYPEWVVDDLYKLIHQSAMGSEHALGDEEKVRNWLIGELEHLEPGSDEPLIDPISPDGKVARIHLRPFLALNIDAEKLLQAFIRTGRTILPSTKLLAEYADLAARLAEDGQLRFSYTEISAYMGKLRLAGYPAVHHSAKYVEQYMPAYRVVALDELPEEILRSA